MNNASVYLVTNTHNGHQYVGVTKKTVLARWREHCSASRKPSVRPICRAIAKYGPEAFVVSVIDTSNDYLHALRILEPHYIQTLQPAYNATTGGDGVPGYHHTAETKVKCGMSMRGKRHSPDTRQRMSASQRGKILSDTHISNMKNAKGAPVTIDGIAFKSKNDAALYAIQTYRMSRNTALRYIGRGVTQFSTIQKHYSNDNAYTGKRYNKWHTTSPSQS